MPNIYAMIVAAIFAGTALVFILYEYLVEQRQNIVMKTATNANAIVLNLFPKEFQQRMMQDAEDRKVQAAKMAGATAAGRNAGKRAFQALGVTGKLESFVDGKQDRLPSKQPGVNPFATKPIAELYPAATLMMAGK